MTEGNNSAGKILLRTLKSKTPRKKRHNGEMEMSGRLIQSRQHVRYLAYNILNKVFQGDDMLQRRREAALEEEENGV